MGLVQENNKLSRMIIDKALNEGILSRSVKEDDVEYQIYELSEDVPELSSPGQEPVTLKYYCGFINNETLLYFGLDFGVCIQICENTLREYFELAQSEEFSESTNLSAVSLDKRVLN